MTPSQLDHLKLIDAHLERLLAIAEKRTQGEWRVTNGVYDYSPEATQFPEGPSIRLNGNDDILFQLGQEYNAAYIASCAGNAEAGWMATRAMAQHWIDLGECLGVTNPKNNPVHLPPKQSKLLESILAQWPLESLVANG